jgi:hypothetical protein
MVVVVAVTVVVVVAVAVTLLVVSVTVLMVSVVSVAVLVVSVAVVRVTVVSVALVTVTVEVVSVSPGHHSRRSSSRVLPPDTQRDRLELHPQPCISLQNLGHTWDAQVEDELHSPIVICLADVFPTVPCFLGATHFIFLVFHPQSGALVAQSAPHKNWLQNSSCVGAGGGVGAAVGQSPIVYSLGFVLAPVTHSPSPLLSEALLPDFQPHPCS